MRIQYLTIIFVIIILPIIIITSVYNRMQINTIRLQKEYNGRLNDATYDAIKAFQINTLSSNFSSNDDSQRRNVEASIETFITSISTGLKASGYKYNAVKTYIPAILFTLYDGYYIYSPTDNNGKIEHILKPINSYSQRYIYGDIDVVINYTLDNYMSVYGKIGNNSVRKSGYFNAYVLTDEIEDQNEILSERLFITKETFSPYTKTYPYAVENGIKVFYDEVTNRWFTKYRTYDEENDIWITHEYVIQYVNTTLTPDKIVGEEELTISSIDYGFDEKRVDENDYIQGFMEEHKYCYIRDANNSEYRRKTYFDEESGRSFTYYNSTKQYISDVNYHDDDSYVEYVKDSKEFSKWVQDNLSKLPISSARELDGQTIQLFENDNAKFLDITNNIPEETYSLFGTHKREVIKRSVEKNLVSAINNYDRNSVALDTTYHFKMPVISEEEWDKILTNISLVTFMQGLPMGFKVFNSYSIVTCSTNPQFISDDMLYFINEGGDTYHNIGCTELDINKKVVGYRNSDFERTILTVNNQAEINMSYFKHDELPCYYCVVNKLYSKLENDNNPEVRTSKGVCNIFDENSVDYNWSQAKKRRAIYQMALGRERYNIVN